MTTGNSDEVSPLVVRQREPFNAETPLNSQTEPVTNVPEFYVRSHFPTPASPSQISVGGAVSHPRRAWTLEEMKPSRFH